MYHMLCCTNTCYHIIARTFVYFTPLHTLYTYLVITTHSIFSFGHVTETLTWWPRWFFSSSLAAFRWLNDLNLLATMALNTPFSDFKTTGDDKHDIEVYFEVLMDYCTMQNWFDSSKETGSKMEETRESDGMSSDVTIPCEQSGL